MKLTEVTHIAVLVINLCIMAVTFAIFWIQGGKVLKIYPSLDTVDIRFREKWASGRSNNSFRTRMGGAQNILDIVVTQDELWIRTPRLFAGITKRFKLLKKSKLTQIQSIQVNRQTVLVQINEEFNKTSEVELKMKNPAVFKNTIEGLLQSR